MIHGDIKPTNVLLHALDRRPRVLDFGLARIVGVSTLMPGAIGTVPYAAPELLAGQMRNALSDQWSFFVTLWHCIDGKLPIIATSAPNIPSTDEKMLRAIEGWAGTSTLHTPIPEALAEILRIGLSFDPRDRFASMQAVVVALENMFVRGLVEGGALKSTTGSGGPALMGAVREPTTDEPTDEPATDEPATDEPTTDEPIADQPTTAPRRPKGTWGKGVLVVLLLLAGPGLLGAHIYLLGKQMASEAEVARTATQPEPEPEPSRCDQAATDFDSAFMALEAGTELQAIYDIWLPAYFTLHECDAEVAAERSLRLARDMAERQKAEKIKRLTPAAIASRAAESYKKTQDWAHAAEARELAADLYRAAEAPENAESQLRCLSYNLSGEECPLAAVAR